MNNVISLFKNRSFVFWVLAQIVSPIAEGFAVILITWSVWQQSTSTGILAITLLLGALPQIVLGVFAGVATDWFNRKKIVMFCNAMRAVAMVILGILAFSNLLSAAVFMLASFFIGFLRLFAMTAYRAALPGIVHREQLMLANTITNSCRMAFYLMGPISAGFFLNILSTGHIMLINAILFIVSLILLIPVQVKQVKEEEIGRRSLFKDLGTGYRLITKDGLIFSIFITFAVFTCFGRGIAHLGSLMVSNEINLDASGFGMLKSADGFGYLIAGILLLRLKITNAYRTMMIAWMIGGMAFLFIPFSVSLWLPFLVFFIVGVTQPFVDVPLVTMIQQRVADQHLGKVFGFHTVTIWVGEFMAYAIFGYLFGVFTPTLVYASSGVIVVLMALVMLFIGRVSIRLNKELEGKNHQLQI